MNGEKIVSEDGKTILTRSLSNPDVYINSSHEENERAWGREILENEAFDTESIGYLEYHPKVFSRVGIVVLSDMHFGGPSVKVKRAQVGINFLANTANAIGIGAGDNSDCTYGASNAQDQKLNSVRAEDQLVEALRPVKRKIVLYEPGNHDSPDGNRNTVSNTARAKSVANRLDVPYFPYGAVLAIELPIPGTYKTKMMNVFVFHCSGKASGKAGAVDATFNRAMSALSRAGIVPDVVVGGHFHAGVGGLFPWEYSLKDKSGSVIGKKVKNIKVISSYTVQDSGPYAAFNNMRESETNMNFIDIGWKKNPYYSNDSINEEYVADIVDFPLLHPKEDKISAPARNYLELYREPDVQIAKLRAHYRNKSLDYTFKEFNKAINGVAPKDADKKMED